MPFDTSTRLYSLLAERINVPICNEKRSDTICVRPMISYGRSGETCQPRALPSEMLAAEQRLLPCQSRHCLFGTSRSCDKKTRTVLSVSFVWSEWRDLNSRPYGPEPYALPNCATPRLQSFMTAFRNIHHLSLFCNRNEKRKQKNIDYFPYLLKTIAKSLFFDI